MTPTCPQLTTVPRICGGQVDLRVGKLIQRNKLSPTCPQLTAVARICGGQVDLWVGRFIAKPIKCIFSECSKGSENFCHLEILMWCVWWGFFSYLSVIFFFNGLKEYLKDFSMTWASVILKYLKSWLICVKRVKRLKCLEKIGRKVEPYLLSNTKCQ